MKRLILLFVFILSFSLVSAISVDDFSLADLGFTGFVVEVNLDTSGTAQVLYGRTGALGSATNLASSSSEHLLQVDGLDEGTVYFYRVVGIDSSGNSYSSAISLTRTASNSGSSSSNNQPVDTSELKAFPTAQGFGRYASGGRGGDVYEVTNLNNDGLGSLRHGLSSANGPRTIIFKVAGYIDLRSNLEINGDITVAGETAPGDGITLRYNDVWIKGSNVIIRYIRIRPGETSDDGDDALKIRNFNSDISEDIMLDHLSLSWSRDEVFSTSQPSSGTASSKRVTLQNSILSQGFGSGNTLLNNVQDMSVYNNLFANTPYRNPITTDCYSSIEVVNNLVYNWRWATSTAWGSKMDSIGNVYRVGNVKPSGSAHSLQDPKTNCAISGIKVQDADVHQTGNIYSGNTAPEPIANRKWNAAQRDTRQVLGSDINPMSVINDEGASLEAKLLSHVGASLSRDRIDAQMIRDYKELTGGTYSSVSAAGGYPTLRSGTPYPDTDRDGIDDRWESNINGQVGRADNNGDHDGDGYTNVEEYLHYLAGEGHS